MHFYKCALPEYSQNNKKADLKNKTRFKIIIIKLY